MRVCIVHSWHHRRGGDSVAAWDLADRLEAAGHEVARFAMRHPDNDPSPWSVRWPVWVEPGQPADARHRVRSWASLAWNEDAGRAARTLYRDVRPDIVHAHHIHRHLTPAVLHAARALGIPIVQTAHDYEWICPEGHLFSQGAPCTACRGHRYGEAVLRRCKRGALAPSVAVAAEKWLHQAMGARNWVDQYLSPSRFLAEKLASFGIPRERIAVLPNPVAVSPPTPPGKGWVFAGRLTREKGSAVLAAAMKDLPGTVVGDGPEALALQSGMPGTRFTGHLSAAGVNAQLGAAAVVVVPSIWWENQPYAVTEAQALGRAVVASDLGGIPELIDHGRDGLLVPAGDPRALREAVGALLADPGRCQALGDAARTRVARDLDPARHLTATLEVYQRIRNR